MSSCLQHNHAHSHEHDYQHNENFQNIADDHPHQSHPFRKRYTFRDVYNAAATERSFDYVFWMHVSLDIIGDNLIIIASKLLVVIAIFLILGLGYSGFLVIVPLISEQTPHMYYIHMVIGGFIYFNIIFNYFFAVTTNAGTPSDYIHLSPVNQTFNGSLSVTVASPTGQDVALHNYSECKKCRYPKPLRAHHCSLCNTCIMRMDHHCPWLANCVGLRNYRFFFSFLLWVTLGTAYLGLACVPSILSPGSLLFPAGGPDILPLFYPQRLIDAFRSTDHTNSPSSKQSRLGSLRGRHHKVAHLGGNPDDGSLSSVYHQINQTLKYKANNNSKNRINSTKNTKHPMKESDVNAVAENRRLIALNTLVAIQSDLNAPKLDDQSRKLEDNHHLHIVEPHSGRKVEWYETLLQILKGKEVLIFVTFIGSTAVSIGVGVLFGFHFYLGELVGALLAVCCLSLWLSFYS